MSDDPNYFRAKKLTIGLDYDGTITADPNLWSGFIKLCKARGHTVKIVTYRTRGQYSCDQDILDFAAENQIEYVFTAGRAKTEICPEVSVWIDDMPWTLLTSQNPF